MDQEENLNNLIAFINTKDTFWLKDLRDLLGCEDSDDRKNKGNVHINKVIKALTRRNLIQCSGIKCSERQYITLGKVTRKDLDFKTFEEGRKSKFDKK